MNWFFLVPLLLLCYYPIFFASSAVRTASGSASTRWVLRDRIDIVRGTADCLFVLAFGLVLVPWGVIPPAIWGLALAVSVFAFLLAVRDWSDLPLLRPGSKRIGRWAVTVVDLAFAAGVIILVA